MKCSRYTRVLKMIQPRLRLFLPPPPPAPLPTIPSPTEVALS